ncbi:MAG TPA: ABC transporter permease [Microscillaceae bacterium]|nr:ABC transporter permease [Microscillaceae bacterium]
MNKILLIIQREYLVRVRKKSFVIMTLIAPLLFAGLLVGPVLLNQNVNKGKTIEVIDESGLYKGKLEKHSSLKFIYLNESLEAAKKKLPKTKHEALLYIPKVNLDKPSGMKLFAEKRVSVEVERNVEKAISKVTENIKLLKSGIDKKVLSEIKTDISVDTQNLKGEESSGRAAMIIGYVSAFLIYFAIFLYGVQVMRGVIEEKVNRIIEVMISSVKPFQLMMGKIIGVALVGITQFILWIGLSVAITFAAGKLMGGNNAKVSQEATTSITKNMDAETQAMMKEELAGGNKIFRAINSIPVTTTIISFLLYFIGGYLLYSALFAAVGSAADTETDTQQFVLPISMPLVFAMVAASAIVRDPNGPLAFWMSMIPLTSPIAMMIRIPYGVATWEIILSLVLLVGGFIAITWLAGRIYRVGVLMYGKKVNFKEIAKWLFYKV